MKIVAVTEQNIGDAGLIHSESWKESHRSFCSPEFVEKHTQSAQADYLRKEIEVGKTVFMLLDPHPVGIVSVWGDLIENLYVLPWEQRKRYGTKLLQHAVGHCIGTPRLWILNTNEGACRLYLRNGFRITGNQKSLKKGMFEMELRRDSRGLFELAMKHIYGDGVPEDNELAVKLLTEAREMGHIEATYNLGICYHYGYGVEADLEKAFALYLESANGGYGKGMELVGRFYNRAIYVEQNRKQAEYWLRKAMESSDLDAVGEAKKELDTEVL